MDTSPNATPKWLRSSGTESLSDHEATTVKIANCYDDKTSVLRGQITTTLKRLTKRMSYTDCLCVRRRYCPYRNTIEELTPDLRVIYQEITRCSCPCAYCQDVPSLRNCLFPQGEVFGLPSRLVLDIPDFDRLNLNSLCVANRIHTDYRVFARNADLLYRHDTRRQQIVVCVPDSDVSSTPYIHKVFGLDDSWTDDPLKLPSVESQVPIDFDGTIQVDNSPIQLDATQVIRCSCNGVPCQCTPLTSTELMSLQFQHTVDSQNLPCVSS